MSIKKISTLTIATIVSLATQVFAQPAGPAGPPPVYSSPDTSTTSGPANQPQVQGKVFEMPDQQQPRVTRQELIRDVAVGILQVLLTPRDKQPKQRLRGELVMPAICSNLTGYKGKCTFYQFTNSDFPNTDNSCGQAALAYAMYTAGLHEKFAPKDLAKNIWDYAPPKITLANLYQIKGTLGTDWRQVNYALDGYGKAFGIKYAWVDGVSEIKKFLGMNLPVMIMLDCGTLPQFKYQWYTGHWVTAFGYDKDYIYVSNFPQNRMTWQQLDDAYRKGTLAVGHGTSGKAVVVYK